MKKKKPSTNSQRLPLQTYWLGFAKIRREVKKKTRKHCHCHALPTHCSVPNFAPHPFWRLDQHLTMKCSCADSPLFWNINSTINIVAMVRNEKRALPKWKPAHVSPIYGCLNSPIHVRFHSYAREWKMTKIQFCVFVFVKMCLDGTFCFRCAIQHPARYRFYFLLPFCCWNDSHPTKYELNIVLNRNRFA